MDSKTLYRIASNVVEASFLTCAVLAYAGAYTMIAWCPSVGWSDVSLFGAACVTLALPWAYLKDRSKDHEPWIANSYRCPECGAEWMDFDETSVPGTCFTCDTEDIQPFSSGPFHQ